MFISDEFDKFMINGKEFGILVIYVFVELTMGFHMGNHEFEIIFYKGLMNFKVTSFGFEKGSLKVFFIENTKCT